MHWTTSNPKIKKIGEWLTNFKVLSAVFLGYLIFTSLFRPFLNFILTSFPTLFVKDPAAISKYISTDVFGVYPIYRNAFFNLINQKDLYLPDPALDYFLYTPTFALLMAPCAVLPDILGALLWNILNLLPMLLAVRILPFKDYQKAIVLWLIFMPVMNNVQHFQSNILVTALIVLSFAMFEKNKVVYAAILLALGFFVKVYVLGFAIIFLFYPNKIKFLLSIAAAFIVFTFLPLIAVPWDQLLFLYKQWVHSLGLDTSCNINFMGVCRGLFDIHIDAIHIQIYSMLFLLMPLLRLKAYRQDSFRMCYLVLLMVWVVIFSHKSESPSYVVALSGIALWFAMQKEYSTFKIFLLMFLLLFSYFSSTDIFPRLLRKYFMLYCGVKAIPCILLFFVVLYELMVSKFNNTDNKTEIEIKNG